MGNESLIEWYFGLTPHVPGEGIQWRWISQTLWPDGWPAWWGCVVAVAVLGVLVWSYRQEAARLLAWQRGLLLMLRLSALGVILALWTQPALMVSRSGLPCVAILLDTSASMGFRDGPGSTGQSAGTQEAAAPRRWDEVLGAIAKSDSRFLRELLRQHPVRFYQFSSTATPVRSPGNSSQEANSSAGLIPVTAESIQAWTQELRKLSPVGASTRPAEAVRQVLAELRGMPPAALVVMTDGIASESDADRLSTVAELVRRRGTNLFVVPVGSRDAPRDLQLFDVVMDEVAFAGDPVIISGKVRASGLPGTPVTVQVTSPADSQPLAQTIVSLKPGEGAERFELTLTTKDEAELDLMISALPVPGEFRVDNNQETRHLSVRKERLRVLLVESSPRYEFRYLKQWLERDASVVLQTLLLEADAEYAREDRTALSYFPVQKEDLWTYDVVILGDVSPDQLGGTAAQWMQDYVREKGGSLLLMAGSRHNPASFPGTPLESLLPFEVGNADLQGLAKPQAESFRPRLTLDGQKGVPMFRFAENELASLEAWNRLPGFYGRLPIQKVKPGVRILVEHPFDQGAEGPMPVILLQQIGAGKVLYHATDELWRWRFRTGDTIFGKYWGQAIRYLSRTRLLGKDRSAELLVDRQSYLQGEPVLLRVRFLDDRATPRQNEGVVVSVERAGGARQEITLQKLPHLPSVFEAQVAGLPEGQFHASLARPSFDIAPPSADFRVESQQRELRERGVDRADLQLATETAGGALVELSELENLPARIPAGKPVALEQGRIIPLWTRWEPLLVFVGLLVTEWCLRRKWQLV